MQPPVSPRLCGHLVAETVDQLRGSPSSASAPRTGGGNKQLAAIGVYGNGAYELTELEVPGRGVAESQGRARPSSPNKAGCCGRWLDHREGDGAKNNTW